MLLLGYAGLTCTGLTSCTSLLTPGETVAAHARGHVEEPGTAPSDGQYVLMHKYVDGAPLVTTSLSRGDRLGFATDQTGRIVAVAGDDEWIYTDNDYVWVRRRP